MRWFDRLARSSEIAYVRRTGRRSSQGTLTAYVAESRNGRSSIAIAVSKTVGIAVVRNRIRRRIYGALDMLGRLALESNGPRRVFFVVRPSAAAAEYATLAADVGRVLRTTGVAASDVPSSRHGAPR